MSWQSESTDNDWLAVAAFVGLVLLVVVFGILGALTFYAYSCESRWAASGLKTDWGPIKGCLVQMPSGRWIPDSRVRDIDLSSPPATTSKTPATPPP